ncbi:leucine-rich repeat LGI family member 3 isoform X1 [Scyliorhinus canicula]|uniref:leucine-rich repeat LGI family member 3 isoform X1 n=2 Tax=Scyliorhinus canicula TaxID=7830 RepID=UPI0018F70FB6|nr:leucine-rich repeat LGI family member 3 isoform X1 [Scyliorhinus canicula]
MSRPEGGISKRWLTAVMFLFWVLCLCLSVEAKKWPKDSLCPASCSCTKDSAFCVASRSIPRTFADHFTSLTFVNAKFSQIPERAFSHLRTLQFLLMNSNSFSLIGNDAFTGLSHLQYLFIENNSIRAISKYAFRGLKSLNHLSLGNNNLLTLPRNIFADLHVLTHLDLRGNAFHCDCKVKWLIEWLQTTNSTVPAVYCASPSKYQNVRINQLPIKDFECVRTEFTTYQTLPFQAISIESFMYADDLYVTFAQLNNGNCTFLMWDHVEMFFRKSDNISAHSAVYCKPLVIEGQLYVVVAQLFHGSHIYRWDRYGGTFIRFQDIDATKIRKPNDIVAFTIEGEQYFVIADSSKAGVSTIYKWSKGGFYSHHSLHPWHRDTDIEYVEMDNKAKLILSSSTQTPVIYQWNRAQRQFAYLTEIPNMLDVHAVKHFRVRKAVYLCLSHFIGDSRVVKWESQRFTEIQALPSRGAMVAQPFRVAGWQYVVLGSDFSFSHVYLWDAEKLGFDRFQDWSVRAPRAFHLVSIDGMHLVLAPSFKGNTIIYRHVVVDTSA